MLLGGRQDAGGAGPAPLMGAIALGSSDAGKCNYKLISAGFHCLFLPVAAALH